MSLADIQKGLIKAILHGVFVDTHGLVADGPVPAADGFRVYRGTVLSGLVNALRLSYPTVARYSGETAFDRLAEAYALQSPPSAACLNLYGSGFADFLGRSACAAALCEMARFDWSIAESAASACGERRIEIAPGTCAVLEGSLRVAKFELPVDAFRERIEAGMSVDAIAAAEPIWLAFWRRASEVATLRLPAEGALFLQALLDGDRTEAALETTLCCTDATQLAAFLQDGFCRLPFVRIATMAQKDPIP